MEYSQTSFLRRILSSVIDILILFISSLLIYTLVAFPIGKSFIDFDGQVILQKELTLKIYDHMYQTGLYIEGDNEQPLDAESIYKRYIASLFEDEKNDSGSYSNPFAYYYVTYLNKYSVSEFNLEILDVEGNNSDIFQYRDGDKNKVCELRKDNKFYSNLKEFYLGSNSSEAQKANERLTAHFQRTWYRAVDYEKNNSEEISNYINEFNSSLYMQGYAIGIPAFASVFICISAFYLFVPLLNKQRTIGKSLLLIYLIDGNNQIISKPKTILRYLLYLIRFIYMPFFVMYAVVGLENACKVILFEINGFTLPYATVAFTFILLELINLFIVCLSNKHREYIDLITFVDNKQLYIV